MEVKKAKGGLPNSLWDTYSSMANCYGGIILLGVIEKEDGSFATTGLKDVEKLKKDFWNSINNSKKVSINLLTDDNVEVYEIDEDVVMVIHVPRATREEIRFILMIICLVELFDVTAKEIIIVRQVRFELCFGIRRKKHQI